MTRSVWKGPFVDGYLLKKADKARASGRNEVIKISKKRIAKAALAVLQSAIANAENNHQLNIDKLYVSEAFVGKGLVMKRMHARGRGRGARVLKPFSNLTIVVTERGE